MTVRKLLYLLTALVISAMLLTTGCEELATEGENDSDSLFTVSFNLVVPSNEELNGATVVTYLWGSVDDETPYDSAVTVIANNAASTSLIDVAEGTYIFLAVVVNGSENRDDGTLEKGDIFWGAPDITVNDDVTVALTADHWQRFHSVIFGLKGIPSGHTGQIIAAGVMPDGASWMDVDDNLIWGTYTKIYYNNTFLAPGPVDAETDEEWLNDSLPSNNYDVVFLLDVDGQVSDYDGEGPVDPITDGDYYYIYDFNHQFSASDYDVPILTASFTPIELEGNTLTINWELPYFEGPQVTEFDSVMLEASLWFDLNADEPVRCSQIPLNNTSGTITINNVTDSIYHVLLEIDNGYEYDSLSYGDEMVGFVFWGGLDVVINNDITIDVEPNWWQWGLDIGVGIKGIPSGNDGEFIFLHLIEDGANPMAFHDNEDFIRGGVGIVYNNSALVALLPKMEFDNPDSINLAGTFFDSIPQLPNGNYDIVAHVDQDFDTSMFHQNDSLKVMYNPFDIGEPAAIINYSYDASDPNDEIQILTGSFSLLDGIYGNVSCSAYTGGDIYVFLFKDDPTNYPLHDTLYEVIPFSFEVLTDTGAYAMAAFTGIQGVVVGVWDADSSGVMGNPMDSLDLGGPNEGDYLGMYSSVFGEPDTVTSPADNIDFAIDIPFHDSLFGDSL